MRTTKRILAIILFPYHRLVWRELQTGRAKRALVHISISHLLMAAGYAYYYKRCVELEHSGNTGPKSTAEALQGLYKPLDR